MGRIRAAFPDGDLTRQRSPGTCGKAFGNDGGDHDYKGDSKRTRQNRLGKDETEGAGLYWQGGGQSRGSRVGGETYPANASAHSEEGSDREVLQLRHWSARDPRARSVLSALSRLP
jgi:hypothetical protein